MTERDPLKGAAAIARYIGVSVRSFHRNLRDEMVDFGAVYYVGRQRGNKQTNAHKVKVREFLDSKKGDVI